MNDTIKYPRNEKVWVSFYNKGELQWIITSKAKDREMYFLYKIKDDKCIKYAKNRDPRVLEKQMK